MPRLRLNKVLAQAGLTSRRGADRVIIEGRVAINGVVTRELATLADPEVDVVTVDGTPLGRSESLRYVLLHKPRGVVSTVRDPQGRPVVTDLVPGGVRLYPVGRLDADVEGALILTNDGPLTHRLLHPRYEVPRVYEAEVAGEVSSRDLARWRAGVELDDGPARPLGVDLLGRGERATTRLRLTFTEGRKHEVKRYCDALGHRVFRLRRVAFGPIEIGRLKPGQWRELTSREVVVLRAMAAADPGA